MATTKPRPYPVIVRLLLGVFSFFLLILTFKVMTALTHPSQYINAYTTVKQGAGRVIDLQKLPILNVNRYLYLVGPILKATNEKSTDPLFKVDTIPVLGPSIFTDQTGAVEVLARHLPLSATNPAEYRYNQPVHMLGWRRADAGFQLYAIAKSQKELLDLLYKASSNWKIILFAQGLLLAGMVFTIFWLLNIALLSNASLQIFQLLIVNLIFLVLFYSVLVLASYPLADTILPTIEILTLANLVFVPLSLILASKRST